MRKLTGRWLIAVSTGPDSMALLSMCMENHMDICVGHVNYHHRDQAEEEEAYIRAFCKENHIPLYVRNEPFHSSGNFEADARKWRYDFFEKIVKEEHLDGVLTAHQEDDVLETWYMQKERNIIPKCWGLAEVNMYHGVVVRRPLLGYTKKQLEEYCDHRHIRYYIDHTNKDDTYSRNRIRNHVTSSMDRKQRDEILKEIEKANIHLIQFRDKAENLICDDSVSLKEYRKENEEVRCCILRMMMDPDNAYHMTLAYLKEIDHILLKQNDFVIPVKGKELVSDHERFFMHVPFETYEDTYTSLDEMHGIEKPCYRITEGKKGVFACSVTDKDFPLIIRSVKEGDQIAMRYGNKSVHRFFIDRHIPKYLRRTWPVVVNTQGHIILVPLLGCDRWHYTVKPDFNVIEYNLTEGDFRDVGR